MSKNIKEILDSRDKNSLPQKGTKRKYYSRRDVQMGHEDSEVDLEDPTNAYEETQVMRRLATDG